MTFCVYILASQRNGTLYTGSTQDLLARVSEHEQKLTPGFTSKYGVTRLVWFEVHDSLESAGMIGGGGVLRLDCSPHLQRLRRLPNVMHAQDGRSVMRAP